MVLKIFTSIIGLVRSRAAKTEVDNWVFQLHYRWTTSFCFLAAGLVAASDFIGKPIMCHGADNVETTFCWITSTFTLNHTIKTPRDAYHLPGVFPQSQQYQAKTYHSYYQWVPFVLFLQGVFFYIPHQLWKSMEGKQVNNLLQGLEIFTFDDNADEKKDKIADYLWLSRGMNWIYFVGYLGCECLNFVNVVGQIFLLDKFLDGMFLNYNNSNKLSDTLYQEDESRNDGLAVRFPKMAKCTFHNYGVSGTIQPKDLLCILPQNLLNEKIFLVMFFWFVTLAVITAIKILLEIIIFASPVLIRLKIIEKRGRLAPSDEMQNMVAQLSLGDYSLLRSIGKNLNARHFADVLQRLINLSSGRVGTYGAPDQLYPSLQHFSTSSPVNYARRPSENMPLSSRHNDSFEDDLGHRATQAYGEETIDVKLRRKQLDNEV